MIIKLTLKKMTFTRFESKSHIFICPNKIIYNDNSYLHRAIDSKTVICIYTILKLNYN